MNSENYKKCKACDTWLSLDEIVNDPKIQPIGMAYLDNEEMEAFYFFYHDVEPCRSSFVIKVEEFQSYIDEEIPETTLLSNDLCDGYCVEIEELRDCEKICHYAPYRRFLLKMLALKEKARSQMEIQK